MTNPLEHWKHVKKVEAHQLRSGEAPSITQFWSQPHGVRLLLMKTDITEKVGSAVHDRGMRAIEQRIGSMVAYPAHAGTLLSRRRRGHSTAIATWFSSGWTKVQETTGGTISTDDDQVGAIARRLGVATISVHYDEFTGNIGLIEAGADGVIVGHTYLTRVLTQPRGNKWHPVIVHEPTPQGLTDALHAIGFNVDTHLLDKTEMITILRIY